MHSTHVYLVTVVLLMVLIILILIVGGKGGGVDGGIVNVHLLTLGASGSARHGTIRGRCTLLEPFLSPRALRVLLCFLRVLLVCLALGVLATVLPGIWCAACCLVIE